MKSHTKEDLRLNFFSARQKASTALPVWDKFFLISDEYLSVWNGEKKNVQIKPVSRNLHFPTLA